ncbi:MAG: beta-ketoacyl-ACP synthase II, partial [Actinomycetia bacterium]|nr:beta-ketoacyl-ACP synthase II [Actinomycetes bacterium]
MKRRVVITGLGPISPNGIGRDEFWRNTIRGKSGIKKITYFDVKEFTTKIAGEVNNFDVLKSLSKKEARRLDKFSQFAVVATEMTLEDAKFEINSENSERVGVIVGSGIGGLETLEREHKILLEKGPGRVSPFLIPMMISNMAAGNVSIYFGAKGPNYCVISACATSTHAVGEAYKLIKEGDADYCICGGVEASITPLALAGFCSVRALSKRNEEPEKASRPFDAERDGFVMSEGAGILFLEELEVAINRGANIYCEVVGYGMSADAYHITSPDPEGKGAVNSMNMSLKNAGVEPEEIDYINAHGTSTKFN